MCRLPGASQLFVLLSLVLLQSLEFRGKNEKQTEKDFVMHQMCFWIGLGLLLFLNYPKHQEKTTVFFGNLRKKMEEKKFIGNFFELV